MKLPFRIITISPVHSDCQFQIFLYVLIFVKCTCVFGQGHTLLHLVDPRCKCRESHRRMPPAGVGASES